jgi:hypothetical protein
LPFLRGTGSNSTRSFLALSGDLQKAADKVALENPGNLDD